jgi:hypothetical protein
MMPMIPDLVPLAAEAQLISAAPIAGPMFLGFLVATAWFTVFGFLASWWNERTNNPRMA